MHSTLLTLSLAAVAAAAPAATNPVIKASTGVYTGVVNSTFPDVHAFVDVPYGMSTAGSNRWMPPVAVPPSSNQFDATKYPPACPQYVTGVKNIWNQKIPQYLQYWGVTNLSAGISAPFATEDCLKLAIWKPANATSASQLPVAMFWTGGGFQTNGILTPGQLPQRWVHRSQSHIVVTINYRMNIMGFPGAAGVTSQNLGLMDQRLALEWVRDNIRYFGGGKSFCPTAEALLLLCLAPARLCLCLSSCHL
jgi:carboxylesterase type B